MSNISNTFSFKFFFLCIVLFAFFFVSSDAIMCYKCKGDDECDFNTRVIYVENCTWATKCWGARIGDHYIRGCADDRCDIQIGLGSYIESKCCYSDKCNNDKFFFPNGAPSTKKAATIVNVLSLIVSVGFLLNFHTLSFF